MARKGDPLLPLFLGISLCVFLKVGGAEVNTTYTIGFMAPSQDSSIPSSLANEWNSAFRVALEVLNSENRSYQLIPNYQHTECDWQKGQRAAENIVVPVNPPLIGSVGPACSDAAMSAARVMWESNSSLISFAATTEVLKIRTDSFSRFFRTVFSDSHQAAAVAASVAKLKIKKVTLLYTQKYYSFNLATEIKEAVSPVANVSDFQLELGENSTINSTQLGIILDTVKSDEFVILAVLPLQAYDIWTAAQNMNKLRFPYWYFGSDGVTAFDPLDTSKTDPRLVAALQGEIGIIPYGGDITNPQCEKFYTYWKAKNYPGFLSEGKNRTRSYVPHLIDAVHTYFVIIDNLIQAKVPVTQENIFQALNGSGPGVPLFQGCTGAIAFDPATGGRNTTAEVPRYSLVSLTHEDWEVKGQVENATILNQLALTAPEGKSGSYSIGSDPFGTLGKANTSIVAATLFAVASASALIGYFWYKRRGGFGPKSYGRIPA